MELLTENIKVVCGEFQGFVTELMREATEEEQNEIKGMISVLYQMYVLTNF